MVFIFYVLYTHSIWLCLTENTYLLLTISSGIIVKSNDSVLLECSKRTKVKRLTKVEQKQYVPSSPLQSNHWRYSVSPAADGK